MSPILTKSDYVAALQCPRRLWLSARAPERAAAPDRMARAIVEEERQIGHLARGLFPGGVLVEGRFEQACARTRELLADPKVPALLDAAFEHEGVRVRAHAVEALATGFGLREVKASRSVRQHQLDDLVVKLWVLRGAGVDVRSVELVQVSEDYTYPGGPIDPARFFSRREVREDVEFLVEDAAKQVSSLFEVVEGDEPAIEPSPHCRRPRVCPFFESCRSEKPEGWIGRLPGLRGARFHDLHARGISRIADIPEDAQLDPRQRRAVQAHRSERGLAVASELPRLLRGSGPPASYLDFESFGPGVPVFAGSRPFQPIVCQWSLHHVDANGACTHAEFLADADADPRRAVAESLISALDGRSAPILVYSPFESTVLGGLAEGVPDLAAALGRIRARLFDLLPVVRGGVYAREFLGSYSLKRVAPALVPGFGYADLETLANGGDAALALARLMREQPPAEERERLRAALLRYCARDTRALLEVHAALRELAG